MNISLRIIGVFGLLLFGFFLYLTFSFPGYVEEAGKNFIKNQIEQKTAEKIDDITLSSKNSKLAQIAGKLYQQHQEEIENIKKHLKNQAHESLAAVIAEMRKLDCECRKKYAQMYKEDFEFRLALSQVTNQKLQNFMKTKYMEVATELKRDVRIFTGSNAFVFLFLLLISFLNPRAITHLCLPGLLLVSATLVCSYFYIFEQNWLFTIIL